MVCGLGAVCVAAAVTFFSINVGINLNFIQTATLPLFFCKKQNSLYLPALPKNKREKESEQDQGREWCGSIIKR